MLLYRSETWIVTGRMMEALEWMHWGVTERIAGSKAAFNRATGAWSHPTIAKVLEAAGLFPLG